MKLKCQKMEEVIMGDMTKNFSRKEFTCQCGCGFASIDSRLVKILQEVRDHFGKPVTVTSGCRCEEHNANVGGASRSKHVIGLAADVKVYGIAVDDVYEYLDNKYPDELGLGKYRSWIHVDTRSRRGRW